MQFRASIVHLAVLVLTAVTAGGSLATSPDQRLLIPPPAASAFTYERLDKDDAMLLVVDLQEGLYQVALDQSSVAMKNNILAHAALGNVFSLPTILTTSSETGTGPGWTADF